MKCVISIVFVIVAITYCVADKYTTKYDNIDIDEILTSDRLLKNYMNCLLDKGRCTPAGKELKDNLPDVLENGCEEKCSEHQQKEGKKVLRYLIDKRRAYYDELEAKYDPEGKYRKKYKQDMEKEGIKI